MSDVSDEELFEDGEEEELNIPEDTDNLSPDEEEGEEEEEKEPSPDPNPLTADVMRDALSMLGRIGDGLAHAYTRVDLRNKDLTDVNVLGDYIHLRHVILSNNAIKDVSALTSLTNLLTLKADKNRITGVHMETMPYLQVASFASNKLRTMEGLAHPLLEKLNLSHNHIERISGLDPSKMLNLTTLDLRGNRLESTIGEFPKTLRELYMPANLLKSVEGLENLENLTILHLRDNLIETLDGFGPSMKSLQYVNIRGNQLKSASELKKLKDLPQLRALSLAENLLSEEDDYRLEVLVAMEVPTNLERVDKDPLEWDELQEARELLATRRAEEVAAEAAAAAEAVAKQASEIEITVSSEDTEPGQGTEGPEVTS